MKQIIDLIRKSFELKEQPAGEFSALKVGPMKFSIEHWDGGLLGNISFMSGSAMMGLMKMETLIINPVKADLPLLSLDTVLAMGKLTVIAEIYDTTIGGFDQSACQAVKEALASHPDRPTSPIWYDNIKLGCSLSKKTGKKALQALEKGLADYVQAYLSVAEKAPELSAGLLEQKRQKADAYVTGLLEHGGPSTDVFVKHLGKEKTEKLFHEVLFG